MAKKDQISVPESLLNMARAAGEKQDKEKENQKRKWAREARQKEILQAKRRAEALPYAIKIVDWVEKFRCSKEGKELITQGTKHNHIDGIFLFTDKLPHQPIRYVGVSLGGVWYMRYGCGAGPIFVGPSALADAVPAPILKAVWQSFQSGAVWELIQSRIERHF